jgi:large conductance mechanosensitive channel
MIKSIFKDFKDFAFKGNLIDMAVGIIIGGAFGTVVKSLVDDIFMPLIGYVTGGVDFSKQTLKLGTVPEGKTWKEAAEAGEVVLVTYGNFLTAFVSFLILAFVLFLVIQKFMAALRKAEPAPAAEAPTPSEEVVLLSEIRDLLRKGGA